MRIALVAIVLIVSIVLGFRVEVGSRPCWRDPTSKLRNSIVNAWATPITPNTNYGAPKAQIANTGYLGKERVLFHKRSIVQTPTIAASDRSMDATMRYYRLFLTFMTLPPPPGFNPAHADTELTVQKVWFNLKSQWRTVSALTGVGLLLATLALLLSPSRFEIKAYLDKPYSSEIAELNSGRTSASGLAQYTPEQVFAYFMRQLLTDEAKQRFFQEIYLPAQDNAPDSAAARQALYQHMSQKVLTITPPPPKKGRDLYSVRIEAPSGEKAAAWTNNFLNQVAEDATRSLFNDAEKDIALQLQNTERDLEEKLRITEQTREDRQAQLTEALQVALAVGIRDPQMTSAQPPRQDGVASVIDGSRLYARGSKSLQAELAVLKNRKDDAPFVDGLREAQSQLRLLAELKPAEKKFKIFHIDGQIIPPVRPFSPKKSMILALGLFMGLCFGVFTALVRSGVIKQLMSADNGSTMPTYATENRHPAYAAMTSGTGTASAKQPV